MVSKEVNPVRGGIQLQSIMKPRGGRINGGIQAAELTPADIKDIAPQDDQLGRRDRFPMQIPL